MNNLYQLRSALATTLHVKEDSSFLNELFQHYVTAQELLNADETELSQVKGIGKVRAKQIAGSLKLARMINQVNVATDYIRSPADAYQLLRYEIGHIDHEEVWILFLNTKNGVIAKHRHTIGSLNSCIVSPREILRKAILRNCCSIIMVHNHPSQHPRPSNEDVQISKRLKECGDIIGIQLLDSMIITINSYCSLKAEGLL